MFKTKYISGCGEESLAAAIDDAWKIRNIEYCAKRESRRLGPSVVRLVKKGAGDIVRATLVAEGQREAQLKPTVIARKQDWRSCLEALGLSGDRV